MTPTYPEFEMEIEHDGMWPTTWSWKVTSWHPEHGLLLRMGSAISKDRAIRKAIRAKHSIDRDDTRVVL